MSVDKAKSSCDYGQFCFHKSAKIKELIEVLVVSNLFTAIFGHN